MLLDIETTNDIAGVSAKIEQLADEFVWARYSREGLHRDPGDDLWQMWKGIYFLETENKTRRQQEKVGANLCICSEYDMKIWDDDGVACVVSRRCGKS